MMKLVALVAVTLVVAGCSGGLSRAVRDEAFPLASFSELHQHPEEYLEETVILGGELVETRNQADGTTLVVLEMPLGYNRRPKDKDESGGRFMVRFDEYLDPAIYKPGLDVTVAGRVKGTEVEPIGDTPYRYVVLEGRELQIWKEYRYYRYYPYYYDPYYYYPYYYPYHYYPFYPYYSHRHKHRSRH